LEINRAQAASRCHHLPLSIGAGIGHNRRLQPADFSA
jgi:hypothetical protein